MWLAILILLGACAPGSVTEFCAVARPIFPSRTDVLSEGTARQMLAHNETGAARCGWSPR
jgi:hypothetical protein